MDENVTRFASLERRVDELDQDLVKLFETIYQLAEIVRGLVDDVTPWQGEPANVVPLERRPLVGDVA